MLLTLLTTSARANDESPVDLVFVIDGSQNMQWTDPSAFRGDAVKCFIDLVAEDVGSVAITQFGGWNETQQRGDAVFPLSSLPKPGMALDQVLDLVKKSIDEKVKPFGQTTDFNRALGAGIQPVLDDLAKDPKRKAWIIVFTGAIAFEVSEGDATRPEYTAAAKAKGADASDFKALNDAALDEFKTKTLPALNQDRIFLTTILLQPSQTEVNSEITDALVKEVHGPGRPLRATKESLRTVFLDALSSVPTSFLQSRATKAFDYAAETGNPKAPVAMKFHRFSFATATRAVVFSESPALEVDVLGPDGKSVAQSPHVKITGQGARYRVASLDKFATSGDYKGKIVSGAEKPVTIEHLWYATIDARPKVELPEHSLPGGPVKGTVSLRAPDGRVIDDPEFLDGLEVALTFKEPNGSPVEIPPPRFVGKAEAPFEFVLGDDARSGEYVVTAKFRALRRADNDFAYESSVATAKTSVHTNVTVSVAPQELLEGESGHVKVDFPTKLPPKGIEVALTDPRGKDHPVLLAVEGRALTGALPLEDVGEWKVKATAPPSIKLTVATPKVDVKKRNIVLLGEDGKEVLKIVLALKWEEASSATFTGTIRVDAKPGEKFLFGSALVHVNVGTIHQEFDATGKPTPGAVMLFAQQKANEDQAATGTFTPSATMGSVQVTREYPVSITYPDKFEKEKWKYLKRALMIAIPLLLLLLILILYLLLRPRFDQHKLVAIGPQNAVMGQHLLKEVFGARGGGKGPPDVAGIMGFSPKGRKGSTRAQLAGLMKETPLFVNGKPIQGTPELKDGDRISFEKGGELCTFLYFSGEVPKDLSPYLPAAGMTEDEIVIEF